MKLTSIIFLFLMIMGRCNPTRVSSGEHTSGDPLTICTGTSFGMCAGYCVKEYVINGATVDLTMFSRDKAQTSPKSCQRTIDQASRDSLNTLADLEAFSKKPERLGCPDCADGGAEYIELQRGDQKHRVTFEYGQTIPGFESLVSALRSQRKAFDECP